MRGEQGGSRDAADDSANSAPMISLNAREFETRVPMN